MPGNARSRIRALCGNTGFDNCDPRAQKICNRLDSRSALGACSPICGLAHPHAGWVGCHLRAAIDRAARKLLEAVIDMRIIRDYGNTLTQAFEILGLAQPIEKMTHTKTKPSLLVLLRKNHHLVCVLKRIGMRFIHLN
jgi:hypothetical protein